MPVLNLRRRVGILLSACSPILMLLASLSSAAQSRSGILKGKIVDGSTHQTIYAAAVSADSSSQESLAKNITSMADGRYSLQLSAGVHTLYFRHEGFQSKVIAGVNISKDDINTLDIVLFPLAPDGKDSILLNSFYTETRRSIYNPVIYSGVISDRLDERTIQSGTDQHGIQVLKRLNGVILENQAGSAHLSTLNISGLGERYNQVMFNGAPLPGFDPTGRAWPLGTIPAEAIGEVSVQKIGDPAKPGDFAGGIVAVNTRDMPDQNFFYLRAGGGFSDATNGKDFYSDKSNDLEWLSFPGSIRDLPKTFPTTLSRYTLAQLNPQEQVFRSKLLKNNLSPVNHGNSRPNDYVVAGFGRAIRLKKGEKIGVVAYVNHQSTERIDASAVQTSPDITANPYPFPNGSKPLIRSFSNDVGYHYTAQLSAVINASMLYGKNKISFKNFLVHSLTGIYTRRSQLLKPDEDSLAHTGINYMSTETTFINTQLSGEHAYGENGKFKLTWVASYAYHRTQNPDERNFLLRQDSTSGNTYEIAHPQAALYDPNRDNPGNLDYQISSTILNPNFTNSGRSWTDTKDHNFTGSVNILVPFNLRNQLQILSGGVYIQTRYRVLNSALYLTKGPGYFPLNELLAPERYYPGGLTVQNYYINASANRNFIYENGRADYQASANLGAAYIRLENHFTKRLFLDWGLRLESNGQLVSNIQYVYSEGFKNPVISPIDENTRTISTSLLPSATLAYEPVDRVRIHATYFKTINRPELQDLTKYRHYDALSFMVRTGSPFLTDTHIDNYDAGISFLATSGTSFSVSGFYKKLDQPVGYIISGYNGSLGNMLSTPYNLPSAKVRGLTADLKIRLDILSSAAPWLSCFSLFASGTWLNSTVSAGPIRNAGKANEHTLSGSPDYTVNGGLIIQHPRLPMVTILYNRIGDYITASGSGTQLKLPGGGSVLTTPDYRVKDRDNLDIQVAQKFWRSRIQLIAGVNNVTNSAYIAYQDLNGNKKFDKPLSLTIQNNSGGFYNGGVDNTVRSIKPQRTYYLTVSYLLK